MNKTFYIILISVFAFIGINTIFYFNIYNKQLHFQTGLLTLQTQLCGNTMEQDGSSFENELNYIPFADDFSMLFADDGVRERGAENLEKLYNRYSDLINKVTVFDNQRNVYSLILDLQNNFVTDYYESQQQAVLRDRYQLFMEGEKYMLSIPYFDESNTVNSNIVIELNFQSFINSVFEKYLLENTTWPWMISENGELMATAEKDIMINQNDLDRINSEILQENEGSMVHFIEVDGIPTRVISVYYPVRLIQRDLAIAFSMKTDIFLRSIIIKIIVITLCSLVLLTLLLYIHFRVIKVRSNKNHVQRISEESLSSMIDTFPFGFLLTEPEGNIHLMNLAAREYLLKDPSDSYKQKKIQDLEIEDLPGPGEDSRYRKFLGPGEVMRIKLGKGDVYLFKNERTAQIGKETNRLIFLFDVTSFEKLKNLDNAALIVKNELLKGMKQEIDQPLQQIQEAIAKLKGQKQPPSQQVQIDAIQKSHDLLSNLVKILTEFSEQDARKVILEEIPFSLRSEINLAHEPFKAIAGKSNTSIITKIRNDVPDNIVGDPFRLRKALNSLIETSVETTTGGRILVSAELLERDQDQIKVRFTVEDTGTGLNVEEIEKFLDLPARKKESVPGGYEKDILRIAVARQHIELMNGQLWIESPSSISTGPDNPGVKFSFTIEASSENSPGVIFTDVKKVENIHCLILTQKKDLPENDRFKHLKDLGLTIRFLIYRPDNLDSVVELVREKSEGIHLLLLVDSSEEDGFELANKISKFIISQKLVRIIHSSFPASDNLTKFKKLGIDYYIKEPFETRRLLEIISNHFPEIPAQETKHIPNDMMTDRHISILLAEDNLINLKVAQALFKSMGYEIDVARNGKEVLNMIDEKNYDIVFMDLLMPEMDGLEAAAAIRKRGHEMPIIALSAVEDNEIREEASKAGISDYLQKPTSEENVRDILLQFFPKT